VNTTAMLRRLAWDVGLPMAAYYTLHTLGSTDLLALLAATGAAALRVALVALRDRVFNAFALVLLLVFGIGLGLSLVSGDPRFLLLKESLVSGGVGLTFLVTAWRGRPITLAATQAFEPDRAAEIAADYDAEPAVRHSHRVCSGVWGGGMLAEAAVRVPLIYLLPVPVMVGLSTAMQVATFAGLIGWTVWHVRRAGSSPTGATAPTDSASAARPASPQPRG